MEYIFEPVNKTELNKFLYNKKINHIIVGVENMTPGNKLKLTKDELNQILIKTNKISLDFTRIFHENEIENIFNLLKDIKTSKLEFIFYSDLAILEILKKLRLDEKAVYDANTYLTNSQDVNAFAKLNKYVVVSNQISTNELIELLNKLGQKVIIHGFGRSIIFYSRRELLTNYFKYRNLIKDSRAKNYYLKEEFREELYPIYEDQNGSYIYEKGYYYLFEELEKLSNVDYVILHSSLLDSKTYEMVIESYLTKNFDKLKQLELDLTKGIMENKSVLLKSEVAKND